MLELYIKRSNCYRIVEHSKVDPEVLNNLKLSFNKFVLTKVKVETFKIQITNICLPTTAAKIAFFGKVYLNPSPFRLATLSDRNVKLN